MVDRIVFFLFYIGINIFRVVPFALLYAKSYFVFVILYYVIGYRKKVVFINLSKCFPDKDTSEINKLTKAFYRDNLSNIFVEGLKGFTMSQKQFANRYKVLNPEILDEYLIRQAKRGLLDEKEVDILCEYFSSEKLMTF